MGVTWFGEAPCFRRRIIIRYGAATTPGSYWLYLRASILLMGAVTERWNRGYVINLILGAHSRIVDTMQSAAGVLRSPCLIFIDLFRRRGFLPHKPISSRTSIPPVHRMSQVVPFAE